MGWSQGSEIAEELWMELRKFIPTDKHFVSAWAIIDVFEEHDCDTMDECAALMRAAGKRKSGKYD